MQETDGTMKRGPPSSNSVLDVALLDVVEGLPAAVSAPTRAYLVSRGVAKLSAVQRLAIPHALEGRDVIARGKTGTGKTLAFLIPTVERLAAAPRDGGGGDGAVRAVVVAHTRELAAQIHAEAETLCARSGLVARLVTGGKSTAFDVDVALGGAVDVLVATPGRLAEHAASTPGFAARLGGCEVAVLDEADELFDNGFARDVGAILAAAAPAARQTLCFSATLSDALLASLARVVKPDRVFADASSEGGPGAGAARAAAAPAPRVAEAAAVLRSGEADCLRAVACAVADELADRPDSARVVVFFPTARLAQFASACLGAALGEQLACLAIHSKLKQAARDRAADAFQTAAPAALFTSDVSARGVDYADVTLVVQCAAPSSRADYVHRLGRTGRAGKAGRGLLLLHDFEASFLDDIATSREGAGGDVADASEAVAALLERRGALVGAVDAAAEAVDAALAASARDAFLSHYTQRKKLTGLAKPELLARADAFCRGALGRPAAPPLDAAFAKSIGLGNVPGVVYGGSGDAATVDKYAKDAEVKAARLAEKARKAAEVRAAKIAAGQKAKAAAAAKRDAAGLL